jgi:hypothetical protein
MQTFNVISDLPNIPAVYAMYGGQGRSFHVAYVGIASKLRSRVEQHLVRRDSSVTTGVSAACLNPDRVTEVRWWKHSDFEKKDVLEAAELVAFDVLEPALRSRGGTTDRAKQLYADQEFRDQMKAVFSEEAIGRLDIRTLEGAWERIEDLEKRVRELEEKARGG